MAKAIAKQEKESTKIVEQPNSTALSFVAEEIDESKYVANFEFKSDEQAISFLKIIQAMSPEVNPANPNYIEGLKQGGFFVTGVNKVFNDGCYIIPCYMVHEHILWKPNNEGFDSKVPYTEELQNQLLRDGSANYLPDGRQVENALTYYILVVDPEEPNKLPIPAVLKCSSTKFTVAKKLNTLLNSAQFNASTKLGFKPPIYRYLVSLNSVSQTNAQKQSFFNFDFKITQTHPYLNKNNMIAVPAILDIAKNLAEMAAANTLNIDFNVDKEVVANESAPAQDLI